MLTRELQDGKTGPESISCSERRLGCDWMCCFGRVVQGLQQQQGAWSIKKAKLFHVCVCV